MALSRPCDGETWRATALGLALQCIERDRQSARLSLRYHLERLIPALDHGLAEMYLDDFGRFAGYVTWALVDWETETALLAEPTAIPSDKAWRNGDRPWIVDLHIPFGDLRGILADLRDRAFADHEFITYARLVRGRRLVKRVSRRSTTSLPGGRTLSQEQPRRLRGEFAHSANGMLERACVLGRCVRLLGQSASGLGSSLAEALDALRWPLLLRQFRLYPDKAGHPAGLMTWAWMSADTLDRNPTRPLHQLHPCEWNEGETLCLCETHLTPAAIPRATEALLGDWFPEQTVVTYPRTDLPGPAGFKRWRPPDRRQLLAYLTGTSP